MPYTFEELPWLSDALKDVLKIDCVAYTRQWNNGLALPPDGFFPVDENVFVSKPLCEQAREALIGGIDIPVLIKGKNRGCIAIVGLDPLRNQKDFGTQQTDKNRIFIGTPYAVHCDGYAKRTKVYRDVINSLLQKGFNIYLTDRHKVYLKGKERKIQIRQEQAMLKTLKRELSKLKPILTVYMGKAGENIHYKSSEKTLWLPHLASRCCWNAAMKLMGKPERANPEGRAKEFVERVMAELVEK